MGIMEKMLRRPFGESFKNQMRTPLAIIGMSPGNSYFKDYEVSFLLKEAVTRFGRCVVMVADVPAIAT